MNWDQIETEWAAMTRRVQADWCRREDAVASPAVPRKIRAANAPALGADRAKAPQPADSGAPTAE